MSVKEQTPYQALAVTKDGISYGREFNIDATSEVDAYNQLVTFGVSRLVVLTDAYGNSIDPRIKCRSIDVSAKSPARTGGQVGVYIAKAFYSSAILEPEPDGYAVWEVESSLQDQDTEVDSVGDPILNSADEPVTGVKVLRPNEVVTARFIRTSMTFVQAVNWSRQFRGRTNSVLWQGAQPREVLCHTLIPKQYQDDEIEFNARFEFKDTYQINGVDVPGWRFAYLDRGKRTRQYSGSTAVVDANGKPVYDNATDSAGKSLQEPINLDGTGKKLSDGATPVFRQKDLYPEVDFNTLGNL